MKKERGGETNVFIYPLVNVLITMSGRGLFSDASPHPPPAFAMSYAKYQVLYDFASEKRPLPDIASILYYQ
jgi:hypothetical protein